MSELNRLIEKYAADLKAKCGIDADMALLTKIAKAAGPSIYNDDASTVSSSDEAELDRVRNNFLVKKLGLSAGPELEKGLNAALDTYGRSNRNKYRVCLQYLLVKHFGKEAVYA
ncbi:DUF2853 family protein [Gellertiella hungarica]|uniref:DUF2853 family protein n=1 Tax=Gellertiella hungarica TaxID=1572859 RepID=A0A7W6NMG6_9HYPH|nr:DUF2853 family protein [Gellertiella hungarica]MBB4066609.1 hypothetical protein [Gellertiella hungarica]